MAAPAKKKGIMGIGDVKKEEQDPSKVLSQSGTVRFGFYLIAAPCFLYSLPDDACVG